MTVAELIAALGEMPPDLRVCVRGYEDGIDDVSAVVIARAALNVNSEWYYGSHEAIDGEYAERKHADSEVADVVFLGASAEWVARDDD